MSAESSDPREGLGKTEPDAERLEFEDLIFRSRALAQTHPFSPHAYRYVNRIVARERTSQPIMELGIWAGHAMTAGYCLRRVEEGDTGRTLEDPPEPLAETLDEAATRIAELLRTEGVGPYLFYEEERVVAALDNLIAGEIERRLSHWQGQIDDESWQEIEEYLAWWVVKGYALAVADHFRSDE